MKTLACAYIYIVAWHRCIVRKPVWYARNSNQHQQQHLSMGMALMLDPYLVTCFSF